MNLALTMYFKIDTADADFKNLVIVKCNCFALKRKSPPKLMMDLGYQSFNRLLYYK